MIKSPRSGLSGPHPPDITRQEKITITSCSSTFVGESGGRGGGGKIGALEWQYQPSPCDSRLVARFKEEEIFTRLRQGPCYHSRATVN